MTARIRRVRRVAARALATLAVSSRDTIAHGGTGHPLAELAWGDTVDGLMMLLMADGLEGLLWEVEMTDPTGKAARLLRQLAGELHALHRLTADRLGREPHDPTTGHAEPSSKYRPFGYWLSRCLVGLAILARHALDTGPPPATTATRRHGLDPLPPQLVTVGATPTRGPTTRIVRVA